MGISQSIWNGSFSETNNLNDPIICILLSTPTMTHCFGKTRSDVQAQAKNDIKNNLLEQRIKFNNTRVYVFNEKVKWKNENKKQNKQNRLTKKKKERTFNEKQNEYVQIKNKERKIR